MPEVPEHLVPRDGLTNSHIEMSGLDVAGSGAAVLRFDMKGHDGSVIGTHRILVSPKKGGGTLDEMVARGHRHMRDVLRQWLYEIDQMAESYEKQAARSNQWDTSDS